MKIGLCIPTLNAARELERLLPALAPCQSFFHRILAIDSSSTDGTADLLRLAGFEVEVIRREDFDHGGTRQLGADRLSDCDLLFYLTQDAIPTSVETFPLLAACFQDQEIGCAFGRQLPHTGAGHVERHARFFSYPNVSVVKSWPESSNLGIMAGAVSNSFAAYRRTALVSVGGFPHGTVCSEDVLVGFKMIFSGWKIHYLAESTVFHSHDYSLRQEFARHFDIGAFYGRFSSRFLAPIGRAEGRGLKFLMSEMKYLLKLDPIKVLRIPFSTLAKYAGFRLGENSKMLPQRLCIAFGMNKAFWRRLRPSKSPSDHADINAIR